MDLRAYYKKLREIEAGIDQPYVVVVSLETSDGGKPGVYTEVARLNAARQIVEGRAQLASKEAADNFYLQNMEAKEIADNEAAVNRMQFVVVPSTGGTKGSKD